jgi:hypothetical protein
MRQAELERAWARVAAARRAVVHLLYPAQEIAREEERRVLRAVVEELGGVQEILRPGRRAGAPING